MSPSAPFSASIPTPRTSMIGREESRRALRALILDQATALVTVIGVGGVGKTRLVQVVAAEVATAFNGNAYWIALASIGEGALVPGAIAAALGVLETPETPLLAALSQRLSAQRCLLVLDNCEHVLDACAETVEQLLAACPALHVLATSREPLRIAGEQQWRVPPLSVPRFELEVTSSPAARLETRDAKLRQVDSVRLFVERARAVTPAFRLTAENAATVAEICLRLDGIPLALELAAARVRMLSIAQILAHLDDGFRLLTGGSRVASTRQQTLRATLDWSYELLSTEEQRFFRRLAVFAGGFDLAAAEAVADAALHHPSALGMGGGAAAAGEGLELLTRLVDKSLVTVEDDATAVRYRLLEPVRQYAWTHLTNRGEAAVAAAEHAAYFCSLAERAGPELRRSDQVAWLEQVERELDNLRAALRWAEEQDELTLVVRIVTALLPFWEVRGLMSEGRRWLAVAFERSYAGRDLPDELTLRALVTDGRLAYWQAEIAAAIARFEESLTLAWRLEDRQGIADATTWLGATHGRRHAFAEAMPRMAEGFALHEALGDKLGAAWALFAQGVACGNAGEWPEATRLFRESLNRYRALGDRRFIAIASLGAGTATTVTDDLPLAAGLLEESLIGLRAVGDCGYMPSGLLTLAWIHARLGDARVAGRLVGAAEALHVSMGTTLAPVLRTTRDSALQSMAEQLSADQIAAALAAGSALTLDQAIDEALKLGGSVAPAPAPPVATGAAMLTPREREVARLLAEGASDREIAETLTIAVGTAGVHVHNILGKLGLNSRWQVADWASARGLARTPAE